MRSPPAKLRTDKDFEAASLLFRSFSPNARVFRAAFQRAISPYRDRALAAAGIEHAKRRTEEVKLEDMTGPRRAHLPQDPVRRISVQLNCAAVYQPSGQPTSLCSASVSNTSIRTADFATKKVKAYAGLYILMTKELDAA